MGDHVMKRKCKMLNSLGAFILCGVLFCLGGCSAAENGYQTVTGQEAIDEEIDVALLSITSTMDPQKVSDTGSEKYVSPYTGCLYRLDENNAAVPELAESCEVSDDGLTYTVKIRDGLRFANGDPITADDFVFAFQRIADPAETSKAIFIIDDICKIKNVEQVNNGSLPVDMLGVRSVDNRTLKFELEEPCPYFIYVLTKTPTSPCSRKFYVDCGGNYGESPDKILSSGPFMVDRYEPLAMQVHYCKNPYYVDADKVRLPGLTFRQVDNSQQAEMIFQAGEMDIIPVARDYLSLSLDDPRLHIQTGGVIEYIQGNYETCEAWQNKNIRRALSKAIDRNSITENYFRAGTEPLTRLIPKTFSPEPDGRDFGEDGDLYYEYTGFDKEEALKCWKEGLKELSVDEITLTLTIAANNQSLGEIIKDQLEKNLPGCHLEVKLVSPTQRLDMMQKGDFELVYAGWSADYPDPNSFLGCFKGDASTNFGHYPGGNADTVLNAAARETDPEKRMKLLHTAEEAYMEDNAVLPLFTKGDAYLFSDKFEGVDISFDGSALEFDRAVKVR